TPVMSSFLPSSTQTSWCGLAELDRWTPAAPILRAASRGGRTGPHRSILGGPMMVHLYDYELPPADPTAGIPNLREALTTAELPDAERKALLAGLFRPERIPGTMERLSTLVADLDASWGDLLTLLDNGTRARRFVAIDEAKTILDRYLPPSVIGGTHDWDVARLHEPYGDGSYHGKLLKRTRKQLRSVSDRRGLTTPFLFRREW
ncbi:MAG TPA: hypothetical protein VFK93_01110, partial [Candidatus Limnocylindria bacterium]|nr:hypothetical protein [Candidatus Limnocylindria bacterium]